MGIRGDGLKIRSNTPPASESLEALHVLIYSSPDALVTKGKEILKHFIGQLVYTEESVINKNSFMYQQIDIFMNGFAYLSTIMGDDVVAELADYIAELHAERIYEHINVVRINVAQKPENIVYLDDYSNNVLLTNKPQPKEKEMSQEENTNQGSNGAVNVDTPPVVEIPPVVDTPKSIAEKVIDQIMPEAMMSKISPEKWHEAFKPKKSFIDIVKDNNILVTTGVIATIAIGAALFFRTRE